jgi:hypothetical protein
MGHLTNVGSRFKQRQSRFGTALGTDFKLWQDGATSIWRGEENLLALNDFPQLVLEEDTSGDELGPLVLDCLPENFPGHIGEYITYPADGDDNSDRYRIGTVQQVRLNNVVERTFLIAYLDPNTGAS